jgi:hypothetical protein
MARRALPLVLALIMCLLAQVSSWGSRDPHNSKGNHKKTRMFAFFVVIKASIILGSIFVFFFLLLRFVSTVGDSRLGLWARDVWWRKVGEPVRVKIHDAKFGERKKDKKKESNKAD